MPDFLPAAMTLLGQRIKTARTEKGLKQHELADLVGVQKSAVSQWESGTIKSIDSVHLIRTAIALGVNPVWLALGTGKKSLLDREPLLDEIEAIVSGAVSAINQCNHLLTNDEKKAIIKKVIRYYLDYSDDEDINIKKIETIVTLSLM